MASRRTTYEIAALIFISIVLIVLLVLVGITFSKVNNPPQSEKESNTTPQTTSEPSKRNDLFSDLFFDV